MTRTIGRTAEHPYPDPVNELVCLDMPLGAAFVERIVRAWDEGDAVFPLDSRLPRPAAEEVLSSVRPTVIATESGDTRVEGAPVESGDAVVVATSGSTGAPKAAVLTHAAVRASAEAVHERLDVSDRDGWFACLPPAHVGGLSVVLRSIVSGVPLRTSPSFTPDACEEAARNGSTLVSLVPTALLRIDPSIFRVVVLGGSRPPADRPANCVATYGMTETGSGVVYDGRPLRGVEVDIRDGVIHLRSPMNMRGYRNAPSPIDGEGWLRTGDIGSWNPDGSLSVQGREGDLIITGGENVWPEAVEDVILRMDGITDCCVVGIADPEWGQAVHAFVVSESAPALGAVREFVKEHLPAHCAPKHLHVADGIPRTALGKPRRGELAASVER